MDYGRAPTSALPGLRSPVSLMPASPHFSVHSLRILNLECVGTYAPDPSDSSGINSDKTGITFVTFDSTSGSSGSATPRIFVGVASVGSPNLFVSDDAGTTCNETFLVVEIYADNLERGIYCWNEH